VFLKVFGCQCFPNLRAYNSHKFSLRSKPCVFLEYNTSHKDYKCYHPETSRIFISRDVIFHEDVFPFSNTTPAPVPPSSNLVSISLPPSIPQTLALSTPPTNPVLNTPSSPTSVSIYSSSIPSVSSLAEPDVSSMQQPLCLHPMRTRSQNNVRTIRQLIDGIVRYPLPQALVSEATLTEPTCFTNAVKVSEWCTVKVSEWRIAMQTEFNALLKNSTWTLVPSSVAKNAVGCK
jgi:hypothetical protein